MTEEQVRKTRHLKTITIVSGSRENAARYIHAHLQDRDRILCPEQEFSLYDKFGTVTYSAEENVQSFHDALQTAQEILESPNVLQLYVRSAAGCEFSREVLAQLDTDLICHIADADTFPAVIGITGSPDSVRVSLSEILKERGFLVFRYAEIYQTLLHSNNSMIEKFYEVAPEIFDDYECDWTRLNHDCMNLLMRRDPLLRSFLTNVIHAHVQSEIVEQLMSAGTPAVIDSPTLIGSRLAKLCSVTVEVSPRQEDAQFRDRCDYVLTSDTDLDAFATKCLAFLSHLGIM